MMMMMAYLQSVFRSALTPKNLMCVMGFILPSNKVVINPACFAKCCFTDSIGDELADGFSYDVCQLLHRWLDSDG